MNCEDAFQDSASKPCKMARSFHVVNLGCKVNRVESDAIAAAMLKRGAQFADEACAEVIFVNTCTVTGEADKKARKAVRHALNVNPDARVIVTGCAVAIDADTFSALDPRVAVVQRTRLFADFLSDGDLMLTESPLAGDLAMNAGSRTNDLRMGEGFRTRVNIKIQDGCDHACTYCIVHVARGKAKSAPYRQVVEEARAYFQHGAKELVLAGIDLASYRDGDVRLAQLVELLLEEADKACLPGELPARVRASSIEPHTLDEQLIDLLARSNGRLCRHLHLPLQSGSSKVLREMARPYDAAKFREIVEHLYERVPALSLTTDIIVGFPGETDDDFAATMELARASRFSKIHVFPYSRREGTPAAVRVDQVPAEVKAARAASLRALSDELRKADFERRRGSEELVIVEDTCALTESYHELPVPPDAHPGSLVLVRMDDYTDEDLRKRE